MQMIAACATVFIRPGDIVEWLAESRFGRVLSLAVIATAMVVSEELAIGFLRGDPSAYAIGSMTIGAAVAATTLGLTLLTLTFAALFALVERFVLGVVQGYAEYGAVFRAGLAPLAAYVVAVPLALIALLSALYAQPQAEAQIFEYYVLSRLILDIYLIVIGVLALYYVSNLRSVFGAILVRIVSIIGALLLVTLALFAVVAAIQASGVDLAPLADALVAYAGEQS